MIGATVAGWAPPLPGLTITHWLEVPSLYHA
jgi:hypothetical protein